MDSIQWLIVFSLSFMGVGLKGFQHKNVIHDKKIAVFFTSICMAVCDVATIGFIVKDGLIIAIPAGFGAGLGMVSAMFLHDKIFKNGKGK